MFAMYLKFGQSAAWRSAGGNSQYGVTGADALIVG
jgi:hypothetical protein